jgi:hypothetical protein
VASCSSSLAMWPLPFLFLHFFRAEHETRQVSVGVVEKGSVVGGPVCRVYAR